MKILYVEDNPLDAELLQKELGRQKMPLDVHVANTLNQGREQVNTGQGYDLVLIDIGLPDGSGLDLLREIRERKLPLAVVALTGSGDEETAVATLKAGADDYVVKSEGYLGNLPRALKDALLRFHDETIKKSSPLRVLYAEPNADDIELTVKHFSRHAPNFRMKTVGTAAEVMTRLAQPGGDATVWDVLLLDYRLPGMSALELIKAIRLDGGVDTPAVLVTGHGSEDLAVQALRLGFADYLVKAPGYLHKLPATLENAYQRAELCRERERLRQSEEKYRILVENAGEAIFVAQDGMLKFANDKTLETTGYTLEELTSRPFADFIHPEDRQMVTDRYNQRQQGMAVPANYAFRFIHRSGAEHWADLNSVVIDWEGAAAVLIFAKDITERMHSRYEKKKLEAQFRQAQKMEAVGRLAGGVAHDFNNMLSIINGYADLTLEKLNPADPLYNDIQEIQKAGRRSADLTRQLLAFARKQTVLPVILDVNHQIAQSKKMLQRLIGEDIALKLVPAPDLWPVKMDPSQIDQILANLAVNSRDAISGVGTIIIETANTAFDAEYCREHPGFNPGQYVQMIFSDTGCGIDSETQANIFEPFFTTKDEGKGTGLGLSTIYGIAKQNNGFINVYSEPGHGTAIKICLPRFEGEDLPQVVVEIDQPLTGSETILVVEDEEQILHLCRKVLENKGYKIITANNPGEAIIWCEKHADQIHLLISDVVMPTMNGKELHERIKHLKPDAQVLFMSGYTADVITHRGILAEGVRFIQKPFSPRELARRVREALDHA